MWQQWLTSYPELRLIDLDVGRGQSERRSLAPLPALARLMLPYDERILHNFLQMLVDQKTGGAADLAIAESRRGCLLTDIHLLAGAALLAEARLDEAAQALRNCYGAADDPGAAIRRLCPGLRFELRLSPCLLVPLYPNQFSAALMLVVALWLKGEHGEALETLNDMVSQWGLYDEVKLLAGQIYLERNQVDRAIHALKAGADTKHDALELARNYYLARAYFLNGEYRAASRALIPALQMINKVNPHLHARARLLAAECFDRHNLPLEALRQSAHVKPEEIPGDVADEVMQREERWIVGLEHLTDMEIEQMAGADLYQLHVAETDRPADRKELLNTTRNPLNRLRISERSWLKRKAEERLISEYRAAVATGRSAGPQPETPVTSAGKEFRQRIQKALAWWPARREALSKAPPRDSLARQRGETGHLRYDFCGRQARGTVRLAGEKRAALVAAVAGAALLIAICLILIRSCIYL